jgi:hypothetical protein
MRIGRPESPAAVVIFPVLPVKSIMCKVEVRIRAFEYHDTEALAAVHSREVILEAFEDSRVYHIEGRIIEHNPPVLRRFLDDPQGRR